ncbi:hypothetical protein [Methylobacterium trifolii]|uniref:hypothetical protein n=1 Tax=Methylobacterium trifolii TaxID=1003092 RepID=UPI001EE0812A|nr:hypothetical protein [Methylobacterium trifolii]
MAAVIAIGAAPKPAADPTLVLGSTGWTLEYFGPDVTILRATLSRETSGEAGNVVLSCAGRRRRLTIGLPRFARPQAAGTASGSLLIRAFPRSPADPFVIAHVQPSQAGTFSAANEVGQGEEPVLAFARLLLDRPQRLDLLSRDVPRPVAFGSLTPLQVSLSWTPRDTLAFQAFLAACTRASLRQ